jgi:dihydroorotate dehydrogenase
MVCFGYIIGNTLHRGDNRDDDNDNNKHTGMCGKLVDPKFHLNIYGGLFLNQ